MEPEKHPTQQENKCHPNMPAFASEHSFGLTKREYFAALFLQGMLSKNKSENLMNASYVDSYTPNVDVKWATVYADMLIDQLNGNL